MTQKDAAVIGNAGAIIERFGGIRPMANKINVPVTTIQGWKKRNAIPASRLEQILQAAREHSVEITDILDMSATANQNVPAEDAQTSATPTRPQVHIPEQPAHASGGDSFQSRLPVAPLQNVVYEDIVKKISAAENKAVRKSAMINVIFLLIVTAAVVLVLWPQSPVGRGGKRMEALEENLVAMRSDLARMQKVQTAIGDALPENFNEQLAQIKQQAGAAMQQAEEISQDFLSPGALEQRMKRLEEHMEDIAGSPELADFLGRLQTLGMSAEGQDKMAKAWSGLAAALSGAGEDPAALQASIAQAQETNPDLKDAMNGISPGDAEAAAMLMAMAQVRSSLGRDNTPFEQDLKILKRLVGSDSPELQASLDRLAPQAATGVLTPAGLKRELQGLAGDVVAASLQGEDVSFAERAKARFNDVLKVEKDGKLITGTPVQSSVTSAQSKLGQGDIPGAIAELQQLSGDSATLAAPWINKAQATLMAQQVGMMLGRTMQLKAYGRGGVTTADAPLISNQADLYPH